MEFLLDSLAGAFRLLIRPTPEMMEVSLLTLKLSALATVFSVMFGLPLGIYLYATKSRFKKFLLALINTGLAAPPVVVGLLVFLLVSQRGPLSGLGLLYTQAAIVLAETLLGTPVVASLTYSALVSVPFEKVVQLLGFGAGYGNAVFHLLREARAGIYAAVMAAFGAVVSEVGAVLMVGGNIKGETRVLTTSIVQETRLGNYDTALAFAIVLMLLSFAFNYLFTAAQKQEGERPWMHRIWR